MTRSQAGSPTPERPEVDHGAEPAVPDQQVARRDVAVEPHRRSVPASSRVRRPRRPRRDRVSMRPPSAASATAGLRRRTPQGGAPRKKLCAPARGPPDGVERAAGRARTPARSRGEPAGLDQTGRRGLAVEPAADRPVVRVALAGIARGQRHGDRERQLRREDRQPAVLLERRPARSPSAVGRRTVSSVTETVGAVVPAVDLTGVTGRSCPLRELRRDEASDERGVDAGAPVSDHPGSFAGLVAAATGFRARFASTETTK